MIGDIPKNEFDKVLSLLTKPMPFRPMVNIQIEKCKKLLENKAVEFEAIEYFDGDTAHDLLRWALEISNLDSQYGKPARIYTPEDEGLRAVWILSREATEDELIEANNYLAMHSPEPEDHLRPIRFKRVKPFASSGVYGEPSIEIQSQETN